MTGRRHRLRDWLPEILVLVVVLGLTFAGAIYSASH